MIQNLLFSVLGLAVALAWPAPAIASPTYPAVEYEFTGVVGTARCAVRAVFSGAMPGAGALHRFRPLERGRGHRSAMSLPR